MSTTTEHDTAATDTNADDAISAVAAAEHKRDSQRAIDALASPLDQSLRRPNARPQVAAAPSLFDARDEMRTPNMAFSPEQVTLLPEYEVLEGWGVGLAVEALKGLQDVVTNLITAREAIKTDVTRTQAAQVLEVDALHDRLMPAATKRLDAAHATITKTIEAQEQELRKGFNSTSAFAAEIRAHAKALSAGDRIKFINEATAAGDMTTLSAVLSAPPYLSGLDAKMAATFTELANKARFPLVSKRLALLKGAQAKIEHASGVVLKNYEAIIGSRQHTIATLRAQQKKVQTVLNGVVPTV